MSATFSVGERVRVVATDELGTVDAALMDSVNVYVDGESTSRHFTADELVHDLLGELDRSVQRVRSRYGRQLRDVTGLADRIRRSAEHSPEGTHPARGPLISVATVLTLLDGCPRAGDADDGPDLTIGHGLRLEDVREWTAEELGIEGGA